jgi:hypothetical protein
MGTLIHARPVQEERPVVADVVDDGEPLVVLRLAEAPAELLEPQDPGLRGPQASVRVPPRFWSCS